jgi:hypothetical protein
MLIAGFGAAGIFVGPNLRYGRYMCKDKGGDGPS